MICGRVQPSFCRVNTHDGFWGEHEAETSFPSNENGRLERLDLGLVPESASERFQPR